MSEHSAEHALAARLVFTCRARSLTVATAESCTGGLVAAAITGIPGSSTIFGTGYVTYADAAKTSLLGVPSGLIASIGAVSEAVARRMAEGALRKAGADLAVAITGIAGPDGGSDAKPVGTVWFGLANRRRPVSTRRHHFRGDRAAIRAAATLTALTLLLEAAHP